MTAKKLAKELGLSEAAVSLALNNKPGVSTSTRNRVKDAALRAGMDLTKFNSSRNSGQIYLIYFRKNGAVLTDTSFFEELTAGVEEACTESGYRMSYLNLYTAADLQNQLQDLSIQKATGVIILATEMREEDFHVLAFADVPVILLDNHFLSSKVDSVTIANDEGAYLATNYIINKKKCVPGYLHSSYYILNFAERKDGYYKALIHSGFSRSSAVIHELAPSIDGAFADMNSLIQSGEKLASCYFADNDWIAIGAMRAFKENGYRVPQDIAIIGFDDITMSSYTDPALTTVHVPKRYMGIMAVQRLITRMNAQNHYYPVNIRVVPHLVIRQSVL